MKFENLSENHISLSPSTRRLIGIRGFHRCKRRPYSGLKRHSPGDASHYSSGTLQGEAFFGGLHVETIAKLLTIERRYCWILRYALLVTMDQYQSQYHSVYGEKSNK